MGEHILVVGAEGVARSFIADVVKECESDPLFTIDLDEACDMLQTIKVDLILCEMNFGEHSGRDLLQWCSKNTPTLPFILIIEPQGVSDALEALNEGAHSFVTRPFKASQLRQIIDSALSIRRMQTREEGLRREIEARLNRLRQQLVDEVVQKELLFMATLTSLAKAIDARDSYTHQHSTAVALYGKHTARAMGLSAVHQETIHTAGLLHDIGKIGVPEHILLKPGRLSAEEYETIKSHPLRGSEILQPLPDLVPIIEAVRGHHERYDGTGYPDCLVGEDIPLYARILCVCDAWDAMTTDRPYRKGMTFAKAKSILLEEQETQFDPKAVNAFLDIDHAAVIQPMKGG